MQTIKQIADELGITKQAIQKRIFRAPLREDLQGHISLIKGTKYVDDIGIGLIKAVYDTIDVSIDTSDMSIDKNIGKGIDISDTSIDRGIDMSIDGGIDKSIDRGADTSMDSFDGFGGFDYMDALVGMLQKELNLKNKQIEDLIADKEYLKNQLNASHFINAGNIQTNIQTNIQMKLLEVSHQPVKVGKSPGLFGDCLLKVGD